MDRSFQRRAGLGGCGAKLSADATGLRLLWIAVGKDDFLRQRNEEFVAVLKDKGIRHTWQLTDGDHSWPVWRRYLTEFAPLLFTDAK